jgi:phosphoesterase RecJ-like protein
MNYKESNQILEEVKKSKNIVLLCHENPDTDSVLGCLLMDKVLRELGKHVDIFSMDPLSDQNKTLDRGNRIQIKDPKSITFLKYNLFFALDVNEITRLGLETDFRFDGTLVCIDHHDESNYADITVFERDAGSTCSILYYVFKDWGIELDKEDLDNILLGIVTDTDIFRFPYPSSKMFKRTMELIDEGGDYEKAVVFADRCYDVDAMKFWAEAIKNINVDEEYKFAYTTMDRKTYQEYEHADISTRQLSDHFLRNIKDTNFGLVIVENKDGDAKVSIRTRVPGYYVLDLIKGLGGGGHLTGGGALVKGVNFNDAIEIVLEKAREYARKNSEKSN